MPNVPPDKSNYYIHLQKEIAKIIPEEHFRPTVHLHIRGSDKQEQKADYGMLGGVGVIADTSALECFMACRDNNQDTKLSIDLFSCPPPRGEVFKSATFAMRAFHYAKRVRDFTQNKCPNVPLCVLSNTAHVNLKHMQRMTGGRFENMVEKIADDLNKEQTVLILGTKEAADNNLYQNLCEKKKIEYVMPNKEEQEKLQELINQIKRGEDKTEELKSFITTKVKSIQGKSEIQILLSCTELPVGLGDENGIKNFKKYLENECKNVKVSEIINTEHKMINFVHTTLKKNTSSHQSKNDTVTVKPGLSIPKAHLKTSTKAVGRLKSSS